MSTWRVIAGDCREAMKSMADGSVEAIVTDPPAGIGFMAKSWDSDKGGREEWIAWLEAIMRECLRVLKPGGHAVVWSLPRTSHWTGTAIERAGFEVRDVVTHIFGTGFPKSLDVSKAIDKAAGIWRGRCVAVTIAEQPSKGREYERTEKGEAATPAGLEWQGWGTALKPAAEFWWLARKPFKGTVAQNILKHGTGALNIDGTRIATDPERSSGWSKSGSRAGPNIAMSGPNTEREPKPDDPLGRWPANLVLGCACGDGPHDPGCAVRMLDEQSGESASPETVGRGGAMFGCGPRARPGEVNPCFGDSGGASRFFFCAKASRSEREEGLGNEAEYEHSGPRGHTANGDGTPRPRPRPRANNHPTVKSAALMSYLIRLVTPPGGTVLDPFCGSGSTGVAAISGGWDFVGVEMEPEYVAISRQRIGAACPMFAQEETP